MIPVLEHALIGRLAAGLPRSALQLNALHESDAELVRLPGTQTVLAITTDAIVEEIRAGLYVDPWLAGWMAVMVNASDLAAVGAAPVGILLSVTLPVPAPDDLVAGLREGIAAAADASGLPVLGGDTNRGGELAVAGTAVGLISGGRTLTRCGALPGDRLFASGPLGLGSAFALAQLNGGEARVGFQPVARVREGQLLRGYASAAMDTSDGLIATLDELSARNQVGFRIDTGDRAVLHPAAHAAAREAGLPPWCMLAGPHGEFELVFTVPAAVRDAFLDEAGSLGWEPLELGAVTGAPELVWQAGGEVRRLPTTRIRNLFEEVGGDVEAYVGGLCTIWEGERGVGSGTARAPDARLVRRSRAEGTAPRSPLPAPVTPAPAPAAPRG